MHPTLNSKTLKTFLGVYPSSVLSKLFRLRRRQWPPLHLPDTISFQPRFCISELSAGPLRGLSMSPSEIILMSGHQETSHKPLSCSTCFQSSSLCSFSVLFLFCFLQLLPSLEMFAPLLVTE